MAKVLLQAVKMSDAKVSHVSLVERGANRSPFKIIKEDPTMKFGASLDLGRLITRKAEVAVQVVGVVTMKSEGMEAIKKGIADAGFDITVPVEIVEKGEDGTDAGTSVIFKQDGTSLEGESIVIKMSDDVALVCKGFSPYCMDMTVGEMSFSDQVAAQGFYPSISTVMEVARSAVYDTVHKADDPKTAASAVAKMLVEVSKYAESLVSNLPAKCFKLESVVKADPDDEEGDETGAEAAAAAAAAEAANAALALKAEFTPCAGCKSPDACKAAGACKSKKDEAGAVNGTGTDEPLTKEVVAGMVTDAVAESTKAIIAKMDAMMTGLGDKIAKSTGEMESKLTEMAGKVAKTDEAAKTLAAAVKGTMVQPEPGGDHVPQSARKSETAGREIDTAFNRGARSVVHGRSAAR